MKQRVWEHMDDLGTRLEIRMKTKCLMLGKSSCQESIEVLLEDHGDDGGSQPGECFRNRAHIKVQTFHSFFLPTGYKSQVKCCRRRATQTELEVRCEGLHVGLI